MALEFSEDKMFDRLSVILRDFGLNGERGTARRRIHLLEVNQPRMTARHKEFLSKLKRRL